MAQPKKDTRKYHVVRVKGWNETVLNTYDDVDAALQYMNSYGKKNRTGIIATIKANLTDAGLKDREQIAVYDEWLNRILGEK